MLPFYKDLDFINLGTFHKKSVFFAFLEISFKLVNA